MWLCCEISLLLFAPMMKALKPELKEIQFQASVLQNQQLVGETLFQTMAKSPQFYAKHLHLLSTPNTLWYCVARASG